MRLFLHDSKRKLLLVSRDRLREFRDKAWAREYLRPLMDDARNRTAVSDLAADAAIGLHRWKNHEASDHLADRLVRDDLVVVDWTQERIETPHGPQQKKGSTPLEDEMAAAAEHPAQRPEQVHFIEIELLDDQGEPVPNESYFILLPDGSTKSGRLDGEGKARVEGVDPGEAKVSFPDMDRKVYDS